MCTMSPYDFKLQDVHHDLSWMTGPDGLVMKAEQTVHFLKKSLSLHHSRGRSQLPCRLEKGFKVSPQLSKGSLAVPQSLSNPRWSHHQHYLFEPLTPPVGIRKPWNHKQAQTSIYPQRLNDTHEPPALKIQSNFKHILHIINSAKWFELLFIQIFYYYLNNYYTCPINGTAAEIKWSVDRYIKHTN